jgi:hypothetical protein
MCSHALPTRVALCRSRRCRLLRGVVLAILDCRSPSLALLRSLCVFLLLVHAQFPALLSTYPPGLADDLTPCGLPFSLLPSITFASHYLHLPSPPPFALEHTVSRTPVRFTSHHVAFDLFHHKPGSYATLHPCF